MKIALVLLVVTCLVAGQRITTIQLDGVQYFVSRMNPYSPELNYFLAYQYCRSLGLQLASFETKEKADTMTQYLKNAGYTKYDFWTSGNKLGTDMFLWMSTGLPFNATFDYMARRSNRDVPPGTEPQRVARESGDSGSADGCVALKSPTLSWEAQDCTLVKDFICEQTRCYYYNYGSIPVSATQGNRRPYLTTTTPQPETDRDEADRLETEEQHEQHEVTEPEEPTEVHEEEDAGEVAQPETEIPEDPVVGRLMSTVSAKKDNGLPVEKTSRPDDIPNITSLFTKNPGVQTRIESLFEGLETHDIRTLQRQKATERAPEYHTDYDATEATETEIGQTIGPYDSSPDYVNDQPEVGHDMSKDQEEDASTILPDAEPAYRYNIKVRSNGKVLDPPSK